MTDVGNIQEMKTSLKEMTDKMAEFEKQLQEQASALFTKESAFLFEKFPKLQSFSWDQYTPYFNDGDECVFGVNYDYNLCINGYNEYGEGSRHDFEGVITDEEEAYDNNPFQETISVRKPNPEYDPQYVPPGSGHSWMRSAYDRKVMSEEIWVDEPNPAFDADMSEILEAVKEFLAQFKDEHYRQMFGDHVAIQVSRTKGVETVEHEHE